MKLYATTTSERATKGQGGEWLDINIYGENSQILLQLQARQNKEGKTKIGYWGMNNVIIEHNLIHNDLEYIKGKQ